MTADEFDQYREEYPTMPGHELAEWHSRLYRDHPDQSHYNGGAMLQFFSDIKAEFVTEIGGWDGAAARTVLMAHPEIATWVNYEVCREAVAETVCRDERYSAFPKAAYAAEGSDTLVLSHVVEHMINQEVVELLSDTDAKHLYVDSPLSDERCEWAGTTCFHTLRMGWNDLHEFVERQFFSLVGRSGPEIRWYTR